MDGQRFDGLAKSVAGARSRRGMIKGLAGGALGVVLGGTALRDVAAQDVSPQVSDSICGGQPEYCSTTNRFQCGPSGSVCAQLVNGDKRCVIAPPCRKQRRFHCDRNKDCDKGEVCIVVKRCCGNSGGASRLCAVRAA